MRLSLTKGYFGREGTGLGDSGLHCDFYLFLQNESDLIDPTLAVVFDSVDIYEIFFYFLYKIQVSLMGKELAPKTRPQPFLSFL